MCGISGVFDISTSIQNRHSLKELLVACNKSLSHRGPDDQGIWESKGKIGLAQTRLSIIDLSTSGHQPMIDREHGNVIVFNGEIFNFRDINRIHFTEDRFDSTSDTETILKLYSKFGCDLFRYLNGMYAIAIWDNTKRELILARDPSGKKPLYYTQQNGVFAFASEMKALYTLPWIKRELDPIAFSDFLTYNLVIGPNTTIKGIQKFMPGHFMRVNESGIQSYERFKLNDVQDLSTLSENEIADYLFKTVDESVKYRMVSDVPVGLFLSGGVDSSAIGALMRKHSDTPIKSFTIGFEGMADYNELNFAREASQLIGTEHFEKIVKPSDLLEFLPKIVDIYDEPQSDTTAIPIYFLSQLAKKEGIKVVLNGDGADELFAGYSNYMRFVKYDKPYKILKDLPKFVRSGIGAIINNSSSDPALHEIASRLIAGQDLYWPNSSGLKDGIKTNLLSKSMIDAISDHSSYKRITELKQRYREFSGDEHITDLVRWMSYSGYYIADIERFLFRSDRLGMAHSIEARSPFLNYDIVRLALNIRSELKIKNNIAKYILKKSFEGLLPVSLLHRKKMGFCLPIQEWAEETISDYVLSNISAFNSNYDVFSTARVSDIVNQLRNGNRGYANTVWTLYFTMSWFNRWL